MVSKFQESTAFRLFFVWLLIGWFPSASLAEVTRYHSIEGFAAFLNGNPETTALTADGAIILGPASADRFNQPEVSFSAAVVHGEELVLARAEDRMIVAIDERGEQRNIYKVEQSVVTALLSMNGELYVATGPVSKIYRIGASNQADVFFEGESEYIWDMVEGPDGSILCVTGGPGRVMQINSSGNSQILWDSGQTHLRSLAYRKEMGLFVGGGEKGVVYFGEQPDFDSYRALYDTRLNEVTDILVHGDYVYVAGVSGADALVAEQSNDEKPVRTGVPVRSQLVEVALDGTSQVMAGSSDEVIFSLGLDHRGNILVITGATGRSDPRGRIYSVDPKNRMISLLFQSSSRRLTHLLNLGERKLVAVASSGGRITDLSDAYRNQGQFVSAPFDVEINSRFGAVEVLGMFPAGTAVTVALRSGQTAFPDKTWSEWSEAMSVEQLQSLKVPNGRYAQLRLTLSTQGERTPTIMRIRIAYLRKNLAPYVREIMPLRKGMVLQPIFSVPSKQQIVDLVGKTSNLSKLEGKEENSKSKARLVMREGALTVRWIAEDPNKDSLSYGLDVRRTGREDWQVLKEKLDVPFYTLESSQLPDGHYQFRVRVSDAPSNPQGFELENDRESRAVLVDNTPPRVGPISLANQADGLVATVTVSDAVGPLSNAQFSLNGKSFQYLLPDDGLLDGREETLTIRLRKLLPGEHSLTVTVNDAAGNKGIGETLFGIK